MRRFVIQCPDDESVNDAREFFKKLFGRAIIRNTKYQIETAYGIVIMFTKNAQMETHGCKLEDFLILTNRKDDESYPTLKCCTFN